MSPDDNSSKRPTATPPSALLLSLGGVLSVFAGLANTLGGDCERKAIAGTGLLVFAGLCFVAAAILSAAAHLRRRD
jgi:hypothetical protein